MLGKHAAPDQLGFNPKRWFDWLRRDLQCPIRLLGTVADTALIRRFGRDTTLPVIAFGGAPFDSLKSVFRLRVVLARWRNDAVSRSAHSPKCPAAQTFVRCDAGHAVKYFSVFLKPHKLQRTFHKIERPLALPLQRFKPGSAAAYRRLRPAAARDSH